MIFACILIRIIEPWWNKEAKPFKERITSSRHLFVPLLVTALFFILQKIIMGWFFFPEHIGLLSFSVGSVMERLGGYSSWLFIGFGRNLLSITAGIALIVMVIRKTGIDPGKRRVICSILVFFVLYILFLSVNFYSPRYLLSILPLFILLCVFVVTEASRAFRYLSYAVFLVLFANNLWFTMEKRMDADHNLGYADAVAVTKQVTSFCTQQNWQEKHITTNFLMREYLVLPCAGYIEERGIFKHPEREVTDSTDIAIISSTEYSKVFRQQIAFRNGILVKRFEKRNSWSEVYRFR